MKIYFHNKGKLLATEYQGQFYAFNESVLPRKSEAFYKESRLLKTSVK
jgi:hypothetical protein